MHVINTVNNLNILGADKEGGGGWGGGEKVRTP